MEHDQNHHDQTARPGETATAPHRTTAYFGEGAEAEIAIDELERNGVPKNKIGILTTESAQRGPPGASKGVFFPGGLSAAIPGWTAPMAPWMIGGVSPIVVMGSLSLTPHGDRPKDIRELAGILSLDEKAIEPLQSALGRNAVVVTVEAPEREPLVSHMLERNGGHILPLKHD